MWYAAHLVELFRYVNPADQHEFRFYENVVLIEAETSKEAWEKAEQLGKEEATASANSGTTVNGKPVVMEFAGIRKLVECLPYDPDNFFTTGTEITYSEMSVKTEEDLMQYLRGKPVDVEMCDDLTADEET
ncbi:MAG TPA: DUF4288 domain-containing protein [Gemmataceae bacterium]